MHSIASHGGVLSFCYWNRKKIVKKIKRSESKTFVEKLFDKHLQCYEEMLLTNQPCLRKWMNVEHIEISKPMHWLYKLPQFFSCEIALCLFPLKSCWKCSDPFGLKKVIFNNVTNMLHSESWNLFRRFYLSGHLFAENKIKDSAQASSSIREIATLLIVRRCFSAVGCAVVIHFFQLKF